MSHWTLPITTKLLLCTVSKFVPDIVITVPDVPVDGEIEVIVGVAEVE